MVKEISQSWLHHTLFQKNALWRIDTVPIILKDLLIYTNKQHFLPYNGEIHRVLGPLMASVAIKAPSCWIFYVW